MSQSQSLFETDAQPPVDGELNSLRPYLFILIIINIQWIPAHWSRWRGWHRHLCSICVRAPRSSDDTTGRSQPCGDANQLVELKLMAINPNPTNHLPLKICSKEVQFVHSFTYLWSRMMALPLVTLHLALPRLPSAMCCLSNPLFHKHRISIRTKINMYRALVVSVLLYGSEAWSTTLADRRRVRRVHDFNPIIHGKDQEVAPKRDGWIPSSMTSKLICWPQDHQCCPDGLWPTPSGRPLLADCQRSNPSKALNNYNWLMMCDFDGEYIYISFF